VDTKKHVIIVRTLESKWPFGLRANLSRNRPSSRFLFMRIFDYERRYYSKMSITGIIVAAGKSSRMAPDHKMIMKLNGKTLIERSVDSLLPFCDRIIVVTGAFHHEIMESLNGKEKVEYIHNSEFEEGMFSSLKTGLKGAPGDRILFLPGDCPFAEDTVIEEMIDIQDDIVVPEYHGKIGQPVLFSSSVAEELLTESHFLTLREFIRYSDPTLVNVECEEILWDIDTPEDYERAERFFCIKEEGSSYVNLLQA